MPQIHQLHVTKEIDSNGNERVKREGKIIRWGDEPDYVKLYLDSILFIKSLPKGYNPILISFLKRMSYADKGQVIGFTPYIKKEICNELGVSKTRIDHAITDFVKGKILFRLGASTYQFNPHLFGKGDWNDIAEIRTAITFNATGTNFLTEIKRNNDKKDDPNQLKMSLAEGM